MNMKLLGQRVLSIVVAAFLVLSLLPLWKQAEITMFPIVESFVVEQVTHTPNGVEVSGMMTKTRECQFKSLAIYGVPPDSRPRLLDYTFDNNGIVTSRIPGIQQWGPWTIFIEGVEDDWEITMYAYHNCHQFYTLTTELITFTVYNKIGGNHGQERKEER